jgi:TP901 family phage tail tape measure protein
MALKKAGVQLVAEGASAYFNQLGRADQANAAFSKSAASAAQSATDFGRQANSLKMDTLNRQLDDQRTRLGIIAQELAATAQKYGASSIAAQTKEAQLQSLNAKMGGTQDKILALTKAMNAEAAAAQNALSPNDQLRQSISEQALAFAKSGDQIGIFEQIAIGGLRRVGEMAVNAFTNAGAAVAGFVKGSVTAAGDFEASLNRFESVTVKSMSAAGLEIADFNDKFLELGQSTQFSASQAADAANELAKGGVPIKTILGEATEATLSLAAAGEIGLAPAATIVAKQLGVWGDAAGGTTKIADLLAQSANASTVNVDDLALGLANVGGVAKGAGLSFQDTVTAIGLIAPGFSSAADAGTSFKTFLNGLVPTTDSAKDAMRDLGLYSDATGSAFYDNQGNFVGMQKASELLATATKDLTKEQKALALETIFGSDAQRAAIFLSEKGAEGFGDFAKAMDDAGSATDQAALRNRGFNFALESLGGSIETLQIKLGQKLLPILTSIINDGIIPMVNGASKLVDGIDGAAKVVGDLLVPALAGATAAAIAFAVANASTVGTAIALFISQVGTATIAAGSAALSFAAMAIPLAAIAVSIGAVVIGIQNYNKQVAEAEASTLNMAKGYTAAGTALEGYNELQKVSADLAPALNAEAQAQAFIVQRLRGELEAATKAYYEVGGGTAENFNRIVDLNEQLKTHSAALSTTTSRNAELSAEMDRNKQAMLDSMMGVVSSSGGWNAYTAQVTLSKEAIDELKKSLEEIRVTGPAAFADVVNAQAGFTVTMRGLANELANAQTEEQRKGIEQRMLDAGVAYAQEQAAHKSHLGQMLIDYATAQAAINGVSAEALAELTGGIAAAYGVTQDQTALAFGEMTADIDKWAESGGQASDRLVTDLVATGDTAVATKIKMDELARKYEAELIQNFKDGKIDADELALALSKIPARVNSEVNIHTSYTQSGSPPTGKGGATAMATGGPAERGQPYLVGDGPGGRIGPWTELFVPSTSGRILNSSELQALISGSSAGRQAFSMASTSGSGLGWSTSTAPAGGVGVYSGASTAAASAMNTLGTSMGRGFVEGIERSRGPVRDAAQSLASELGKGVKAATPFVAAELSKGVISASRDAGAFVSAERGITMDSRGLLHSGALGRTGRIPATPQQQRWQAEQQTVINSPQFNLGVQTNNSPFVLERSFGQMQAFAEAGL